MFEKEAEEYAKKRAKALWINECNLAYPAMERGYRKGAEYGYSKAKEEDKWHYPSKGEYPKECENVWCYCKGLGIKFFCVGHTIVGGDNKVRWWNNCKSEELRVIAWKEIVLPKELEND